MLLEREKGKKKKTIAIKKSRNIFFSFFFIF
jgi:hypothetical protein